MEINKQALNELLLMNENEFAKKIALITKALGISSSNISAERVRSMLRGMSENDLQRLISSLGNEKAGEIMNIVRGGK